MCMSNLHRLYLKSPHLKNQLIRPDGSLPEQCGNYVVVSKIDIALIWVVLFFCGFSSFAQETNNADIDEVDGGIVTCPPAHNRYWRLRGISGLKGFM